MLRGVVHLSDNLIVYMIVGINIVGIMVSMKEETRDEQDHWKNC